MRSVAPLFSFQPDYHERHNSTIMYNIRRAVLFLVALVYIIHSCEGLTQRTHFVTNRRLKSFETSYGLDSGATINITAASIPTSTRTTILICPNKDFLALANDPNPEKFCEFTMLDLLGCYRVPLDNKRHIIEVTKRDSYRFSFFNCDQDFGRPLHTFEVEIVYTLLNPIDGQLPLGSAPLPKLYEALTIIWGSLLAIWLTLTIITRRRKTTQIHYLLFALVTVKLAVVIVSYVYWDIFDVSGMRLLSLDNATRFLYAIAETSFFCVLLLIAKGWRITRPSLSGEEVKSVAMAFGLLLSTLIFFTFYSEEYYYLSLLIMYFFMLPRIFTSLTQNLRSLENQLWLIENARLNLEITPNITAKARLFKYLRTIVMIYVGGILLVNSLRIVLLFSLPWINTINNEFISLGMVLALCLLLRPRDLIFLSIEQNPQGDIDNALRPLMNLQALLERYQIYSAEDLQNIQAQNRVEPWDMKSTMVVEWPNNETSSADLHRIPLSIAIEEAYENKNKTPEGDKTQ